MLQNTKSRPVLQRTGGPCDGVCGGLAVAWSRIVFGSDFPNMLNVYYHQRCGPLSGLALRSQRREVRPSKPLAQTTKDQP